MSVATVIGRACGGGPLGDAFAPLILEARKELRDDLRFTVFLRVNTVIDKRLPLRFLGIEKNLKY